ncbi:MAG: DUF1684 domain-containing protein [Bacteroidetes bacterium]|nr:DUF1684 domain-containing protein [Bacteroidota bacterium]
MKQLMSIFILIAFSLFATAQRLTYTDSLLQFRNNYVQTHEVVKGNDSMYFRFFPVDEKYRVNASFEKLNDPTGFIMKTSGPRSSRYFRYGVLHFKLDGKDCTVTVYQSERLMSDTSYKDYLFIPFTDSSSGEQSYGGGRYIDCTISDIINNHLLLDFNKAYNPYCAYANGFSCPIPPAENDIPVNIAAGEKAFAKQSH